MSLVSIATSLMTILTTVKGSSSYLSEVFAYDPGYTTAVGLPYATLIDKWVEESNLDTAYNQTLYRFVIRACDVNKDKAQTVTTIRGLVDDILAELRKRENITLGGTVDRVLPFEVSFGWDNSTWNIPMHYAEIAVTVLANFAI